MCPTTQAPVGAWGESTIVCRVVVEVARGKVGGQVETGCVGMQSGEVPPGSAALGSENAASAVSGAPGLNLRPSEKGVRLAQKMQVGP